MAEPKTYSELEIGLHREQTGYHVELRFSNLQSETEIAPARGQADIDLESLLPLQQDAQKYGESLSKQLFADDAIGKLFGKVKTAVESGDQYLRLRLLIGSSAPELHAVRWELLTDPETKRPFATSEKVLFSRFMTSQDWRPIRLRPKSEMKALVAVSAPKNVADYQLAEVDKEGEVARAQESLKGIEVSVAGVDSPLTLDHLIERLREGVDILYLVCHGMMSRRQGPVLFLQDKKGAAGITKGADLALRLSELAEPPRLAVLASCESAGTGKDVDGKSDALSSLAPKLAEGGLPAIIAMQGKISMETVEQAMPVFFEELLKDGQIDRAMAVARGKVRNRPDSWMPAVLLRLKGGRIWYEPGFGVGADDFKKWRALVSSIRSGRFTPILGSGLGERVHGRLRDLAQHLAEENHFPLAPHQRDNVSQVAQYLSVNQSYAFARDSLKRQLREEILAHHKHQLPSELQRAPLPKLLRQVGASQRDDPNDPYRILSELPARIYINTNADNLLVEALKAAGKKPESFHCPWRKESLNPTRYKGEPSQDAPLVYHIFGYFADDDSLVLTEDDFFDYLIGSTINKDLIPEVVRHATTSSALLFLGFQLTEWSFRVLFRIVMSQQGSAQRAEYAHVAVQVDPEEHSLLDVARARVYLKTYFEKGAGMDIFWGTAEDFLKELKKQLEEASEDADEPIEPAPEDEEW